MLSLNDMPSSSSKDTKRQVGTQKNKNPFLTKDEIQHTFIIQHDYGHSSRSSPWPRETIAILRVFSESQDIEAGRPKLIYREQYRSKVRHAEENLVEGLAEWITDHSQEDVGLGDVAPPTREYTLKIAINYSPCKMCADMLIKKLCPERLNELLGTTVSWNVELFFANFYKCHTYPGNPLIDVAKSNIDGLRGLHRQPGFTIGLINDTDKLCKLVLRGQGLMETEKTELKRKYKSPSRVKREDIDRLFFEEKILNYTSAIGANEICGAMEKCLHI